MGRTKAERLAEIEARSKRLLAFDARFGPNVCGLDEVGRGCLFGPVYACLARVQYSDELMEVYDSKALSEKKRDYLYHKIMERVDFYGLAGVDNDYIDEYGINAAIKKAMEEAARCAFVMARDRALEPGAVLVDHVAFPLEGFSHHLFKRGDSASFQIACASIVAKYRRDEFIKSIAEDYPEYDLKNNKGYGTEKHLRALKLYGPSPLHRRSFIGEN